MSKRLALGFSFGLCGPAAAWVGYDFTTMSKLRGLTGWTAGDSAVRAYVVVVLTLQLAAPASLTARAMNHARRGWFLYARFAPARFTHNTWHVSHRAPARTLPAVLSPTTHRQHSPTPHTSSPTHTCTHTTHTHSTLARATLSRARSNVLADSGLRPLPAYSLQQLAENDGAPGRKTFICAGGIVYDVSSSDSFGPGGPSPSI